MEITLCLMACGEDTEAECLAAVAAVRHSVEFQEVRNVSPQTTALNQMIAQCRTPYLVPLDADFILDPDFLTRVVGRVEKHAAEPGWHSILFPLHDTLTRQKIRALKVFRTDIVRRVPYRPGRHPDAVHYRDLRRAGYTAIDLFDTRPIGRHVVRGAGRCYFKYKDWLLCYRKLHGDQPAGQEARRLGRLFDALYRETGAADYLYCWAGMYDGLTAVEPDVGKDAFERAMRYGPQDVAVIRDKLVTKIFL